MNTLEERGLHARGREKLFFIPPRPRKADLLRRVAQEFPGDPQARDLWKYY